MKFRLALILICTCVPSLADSWVVFANSPSGVQIIAGHDETYGTSVAIRDATPVNLAMAHDRLPKSIPPATFALASNRSFNEMLNDLGTHEKFWKESTSSSFQFSASDPRFRYASEYPAGLELFRAWERVKTFGPPWALSQGKLETYLLQSVVALFTRDLAEPFAKLTAPCQSSSVAGSVTNDAALMMDEAVARLRAMVEEAKKTSLGPLTCEITARRRVFVTLVPAPAALEGLRDGTFDVALVDGIDLESARRSDPGYQVLYSAGTANYVFDSNSNWALTTDYDSSKQGETHFLAINKKWHPFANEYAAYTTSRFALPGYYGAPAVNVLTVTGLRRLLDLSKNRALIPYNGPAGNQASRFLGWAMTIAYGPKQKTFPDFFSWPLGLVQLFYAPTFYGFPLNNNIDGRHNLLNDDINRLREPFLLVASATDTRSLDFSWTDYALFAIRDAKGEELLLPPAKFAHYHTLSADIRQLLSDGLSRIAKNPKDLQSLYRKAFGFTSLAPGEPRTKGAVIGSAYLNAVGPDDPCFKKGTATSNLVGKLKGRPLEYGPFIACLKQQDMPTDRKFITLTQFKLFAVESTGERPLSPRDSAKLNDRVRILADIAWARNDRVILRHFRSVADAENETSQLGPTYEIAIYRGEVNETLPLDVKAVWRVDLYAYGDNTDELHDFFIFEVTDDPVPPAAPAGTLAMTARLPAASPLPTADAITPFVNAGGGHTYPSNYPSLSVEWRAENLKTCDLVALKNGTRILSTTIPNPEFPSPLTYPVKVPLSGKATYRVSMDCVDFNGDPLRRAVEAGIEEKPFEATLKMEVGTATAAGFVASNTYLANSLMPKVTVPTTVPIGTAVRVSWDITGFPSPTTALNGSVVLRDPVTTLAILVDGSQAYDDTLVVQGAFPLFEVPRPNTYESRLEVLGVERFIVFTASAAPPPPGPPPSTDPGTPPPKDPGPPPPPTPDPPGTGPGGPPPQPNVARYNPKDITYIGRDGTIFPLDRVLSDPIADPNAPTGDAYFSRDGIHGYKIEFGAGKKVYQYKVIAGGRSFGTPINGDAAVGELNPDNTVRFYNNGAGFSPFPGM